MLRVPFGVGFKLKEPSGQPLRRMATMLREAPRYVQQEAAEAISQGILKLIDQGFASGSDPMGNAWRPPKDGHSPTMIRSGKLRRGYSVRVVRTGSVGYSIEIINSTAYATFLQKGTSKMAPRPQVPGAALPPLYRDLFKRCYDDAIARWWAKRGG